MLVHPDKNMGNEKAVEAFKKLQNAYEVSLYILLILKIKIGNLYLTFMVIMISQILMDSLKRKAYDDELRREEILNVFNRFHNAPRKV